MAEVPGASYTNTRYTELNSGGQELPGASIGTASDYSDLGLGLPGTGYAATSGGSAVVVTYTMRGKRVAAPNDLIYWYPTGASDPTGALAPAPVTEVVCLGSR